MGCHFLLQGIFLTQGSNLGLLLCRQTLYPLNHQGSWMGSEFPLKMRVYMGRIREEDLPAGSPSVFPPRHGSHSAQSLRSDQRKCLLLRKDMSLSVHPLSGPQAQSLSIENLDDVRIPFPSVLRTKGKQSTQPKPQELWLQARKSRTGLPHSQESSGGLLSVLACK